MSENKKKVVAQLASLKEDELQELLTEAKKERAKRQRKATLKAKPKQLPAEEFKEFVRRTKELFVGQHFTRKVKLTLDVEIRQLMAWCEGMEPAIVDVTAKVDCPEIEPWVCKEFSNALMDCSLATVSRGSDTSNQEAWDKMQSEIDRLVSDIEKREDELGLTKDTIWEAVYDRCSKYSQG